MNMNDLDMAPRNDGVIRIPYPIDYTLKKQSFFTTKKLLLGAAWVLFDFYVILHMVGGATALPILSIQVLVLFIFNTFYLRFILFEELYFRGIKEQLESTDFQQSTSVFWDSYEVSTAIERGVEFNILYFTSGRKSVLVRFIRDTKVGAGDDIAYTHAVALGEAYRVAALKNTLEICHLDIMGSAGSDVRIDSLYSNLHTNNTGLRDTVAAIYDNLGYESSGLYSENDIYMFSSWVNDDIFIRDLVDVLDTFMMGNYVDYELLQRKAIREVIEALTNDNAFSVAQACADVYNRTATVMPAFRLLWMDCKGERVEINSVKDTTVVSYYDTRVKVGLFKQIKTAFTIDTRTFKDTSSKKDVKKDVKKGKGVKKDVVSTKEKKVKKEKSIKKGKKVGVSSSKKEDSNV